MPRKPMYETPEEMQEAIDRYFEECQGKPLRDDEGEIVRDKFDEIVYTNARPPTVTGLALALGFTSRQALLNYQGKRAYVDTVTRAKSRIEEYAEQRLYDRDGQRGAEFSLKYNFRWAQEERKNDGGEDGATGVVMLPVVMRASEPPEEAQGDG